MRLNRYLARAGVASRRGADDLIRSGRVCVNGERGELHTIVDVGDTVEVDGRRVEPEQTALLLLHKPQGVVTTVSPSGSVASANSSGTSISATPPTSRAVPRK